MINFLKQVLIIFFYFTFTNLLSANIQNKIVLKVGNEIITEFEIKNKILSTLLITNQDITQKNINKLKKQSVDSLILTKLKKIELSKSNFKNNPNEINLYLNQISSKNISQLKSIFENNKLDFNLFYEEIGIQLKWQKLIYNLYSGKINISESEILDEIKKINLNQVDIYEYKLSEIEILNDGENYDKLTEDLLEQINNIGFENAALKFSISNSNIKKGDIGWINSKTLSKEIYKIINPMKVGEISKPIKQTNVILFLKLVDKRKINLNVTNLEKQKKELISRKKNDRFNLYSRSHLSKLKNLIFIEYQ